MKRLTCFYLVPLSIILICACFFSLFKTTYFELYMQNEVPSYKGDHPVILLVCAIVTLLLCCRAEDLLCGKESRGLRILACVWAGGLSLFFVLLFRCQVVCDSGFLSQYAIEFMKGNYEALLEKDYLYYYPFQLGMIAVLELIYRLFGIENYLAFQLINVVAIVMVIFMLHGITRELFEEKKVIQWELILSMGMLPLFLYAPFVYGDVLGVALGVGAIYSGILYLKRGRWRDLLVSAGAFMLAVAVKSNTNILVVALCITLLLKSVYSRKWVLLVGILGIVLFSQVGVQAINYTYAKRAGIDRVPDGVPRVAWIAMGLQDAVETDNGCGWYNGYNMDVYTESGYDTETAAERSIESIEASIQGFIQDPGHAIYYFYRKFTSQWNDPAFQSLMMNEWYSRYTTPRWRLADFFIYGFGRKILSQVMNLYHLLFLVFSAAGCMAVIRNWRLERACLLLNVFGGILFHMIWEAKSRYALPYFVLLLPVAAYGLTRISGKIKNIYERK